MSHWKQNKYVNRHDMHPVKQDHAKLVKMNRILD